MSKKCKFCGSDVRSDAKFCFACGGSEFIFAEPEGRQPVYNQQPPVNQGWQAPTPQPKKSKAGLIVGIVAAVLIVLAAIGMLAEKVFQAQGYGDNNDDYYNDYYGSNIDDFNDTTNDTTTATTNNSLNIAPEKHYYTKGTFDGRVYTNKWADIKFALPAGYSNADAETYATAENSNTECGAYFMADDTMGLIYICYEKLPAFPIYDEEKYLDAVMDSLDSITQVNYVTTDIYTTTTIGGYTYAKAECTFTNENGTFSNTIFVRKVDNYMICISAMGVTPQANAALVSQITTTK